MNDNHAPQERWLEEALNSEVPPAVEQRLQHRIREFQSRLPTDSRRFSRFNFLRKPAFNYTVSLLLIFFLIVNTTVDGRKWTSDLFWRMYALVDSVSQLQMLGRDKEYNAIIERANQVQPAALDNADVEEIIGIDADGAQLALLIADRNTENWQERTKSMSLLTVNLENGITTAVHQGDIAHLERGTGFDADGRIRGLVFTTREKHPAMDPQTKLVGPYIDALWHWDTIHPPKCLVGGEGVASKLLRFAPDYRMLVYHRSAGSQTAPKMRTIFEDLNTHEQIVWENKQPEFVVGWSKGGDSILLQAREMENDEIKRITFERVSLDGKQVFESLDVDPQWLDWQDPIYYWNNELAYRVRHKKYFTEAHEDRIELLSIEPLLKIASIPGAYLIRRPGGEISLSPRTTDNGEYLSIVSLFDHTSRKLHEIDLDQLHDEFKNVRLGPSNSTLYADEANMLSPDSSWVNITFDYQGRREFGIWNLRDRSTIKHFEGFQPNCAAWSPDGKRQALRARFHPEKDFEGGTILELETGEITHFELPNAVPVVWLDNHRVLWHNRPTAEEKAQKKPIQFVITDLQSNSVRKIDLIEAKKMRM